MLEYGDDSSRFVKKIVSYLSVLVSIVLLFQVDKSSKWC